MSTKAIYSKETYKRDIQKTKEKREKTKEKREVLTRVVFGSPVIV